MKTRRPAVLIAVTFLLLVGLIIPAYAHANLIRSDPPSNSVLPTSPQQIKLYFTEQVDPKLSGAKVYDSTGKEVDTGFSVDPSDATIIIVTLPNLPSGVYTVSWHAISAVDGHHTSGSFAFGVGNVTINIQQTSSSTAYTFPSPLEVIERWLNILADTLFLGGSIFAIFVWLPTVSDQQNDLPNDVKQKVSLRSSRLLISSTIIAVIATILLLIVESIAAAPTNSLTDIIATAYTILSSSRLGQYWIFRMIAVTAAISGSTIVLKIKKPSKNHWKLILVIGLVLSLSTSLTSHNAAATEYDPTINLLADWIHLLAVGVWVGGLAYLAVAVASLSNLKESKGKLVSELLRRFSSIAIIGVGAVGLTGIYNLVLEVGSIAALFGTAYGKILIVKLSIFAPMLAFGAINQFVLYGHIVHANSKSSRSQRQLGRWVRRFKLSLRSELTLGVILLLVVGVLTASSPVAQAPTTAPSYQPLPTILQGYSPQGVNVTLKIYPLQVGDNHFEIDFTNQQGTSITDVSSVFVKFKYLDRILGVSIANATASTTTGTYAFDGTYLSFAGNWQLQVWAQRTSGPDVIVPFQVDVPSFSLRFSELPLANDVGPYGIAVDKNGIIWFAETGTGSIGRYDPTTGALSEYPLPQTGSRPFYIATGNNGTLWISETQYNQIVMFDTSTNTFKTYSIPTSGSVPGGLSLDNLGNVWFTEEIGNNIGRLNPTTGVITEFQIPTTDSIPIQTAVDQRGFAWFTESKGEKIGMINPSNGTITEFQPQNGTLLGPTGITIAPNGSVWFTEHGGNRITQFILANDTFHQHPLPTERAFPFGITYQSNRVWFVEHVANSIATFDPTTGSFNRFPIPNNSSDVQLLAVDQAGNVWFTLPASNVLGVLTPTTSSLQLTSNANNNNFIQIAVIAAVAIAGLTIASLLLGRRRMKRKIRHR
ncbi:MAG TPA: copper resistance protein CopC [Candidatus Acidoferrum sp.]|nr:copper resistance protein CopC [Candidatus Acidoferrum sp.]